MYGNQTLVHNFYIFKSSGACLFVQHLLVWFHLVSFCLVYLEVFKLYNPYIADTKGLRTNSEILICLTVVCSATEVPTEEILMSWSCVLVA